MAAAQSSRARTSADNCSAFKSQVLFMADHLTQLCSRKNWPVATVGTSAGFPHGVGTVAQFVVERFVLDCRTQPGKPSGHVTRAPVGERVMNNCGCELFVA